MPRAFINASQDPRRLRWLLGLFFLCLAIPGAVLIRQGFDQLEFEEFRRQQSIAEDVVRRIEAGLAAAVAVEDARPFSDFEFANTPIDGSDKLVQLSPLSSLAPAGAFPGTIGYFQVDAAGRLSTPLLPASASEQEELVLGEFGREARVKVEAELSKVLEDNRLVGESAVSTTDSGRRVIEQAGRADQSETERQAAVSLPADLDETDDFAGNENFRGQAAFDALAAIASSPSLASETAESTVDQSGDQPARVVGAPSISADSAVPISAIFDELEPLRFNLLDTGQFVLFRNAWRDGERFVQGMLIDRDAFLSASHREIFRNSGIAPGTRMTVSAMGQPIGSLSLPTLTVAGRIDSAALYTARLSPPLAQIEIGFLSGVLERGPGFSPLVWTVIALFVTLVGGFLAMYRFGVQQIQLARQQQDFVSAVSHELKTPLTSIRMYAEMLKSGWVGEDKKQTYYNFIFDEGERLSRLIDNVLQLARLKQGKSAVAAEPVLVSELVDMLRLKLLSQTERADFQLSFAIDQKTCDSVIAVDADALTQVFINLVDNAIKFSSDAEQKEIVVTAKVQSGDSVIFSIRDFGPGIPAKEMKRLFELFYRPDNELTRTKAGTGIGLALVHQLVTAMGGRVDVRNREPGAEFRLQFKRTSGS